MASPQDGGGYWLADKSGDVYASFAGSTTPTTTSSGTSDIASIVAPALRAAQTEPACGCRKPNSDSAASTVAASC
ncbi:MAG: hypothetical protein ACYDEY_08535 [Acidimicrobiales bacterium]